MQYTIHGPFRVHKHKGLVDQRKQAKRNFWEEVEEVERGLPSACGCYLFAIKAAKGIRPWYVGLTRKKTFENECFATHKINIYNQALTGRKGTPLLFLIARRTGKGKFSRLSKNGYRDIAYLEGIMIGAVLNKNRHLMNTMRTQLLKNMCVPCLVNTPKGRPTQPEKDFKRAITK
jgi:hypothetical protein